MTENEKELEKSGTYRGFLLYFVLVLPVRRISSDRGNHWFRRLPEYDRADGGELRCPYRPLLGGRKGTPA